MKKIAVLLAIALAGFSAYATAQTDFPSKPIQVIVGFPAGGNVDVLARVLAQEVKKLLGWEVIVVNKPGASGTLAATNVAAAQSDGYTLGVTTNSPFTLAHFLQDVPADLLERTTALMAMGDQRPMLFVRGDSSFRTVKDLIEQARRNPGKVSIGTPGAGTTTHLVVQAIVLQEKVDVTVVPYKGSPESLTDLLGGHITAVGSAPTGMERYVASGTLRIVASMGDDRMDSVPNAPTLIEEGFAYSASTIYYVYGPRGLPAAVAKRLIDAFGEATRTPAYLDMSRKNSVDIRKLISGAALERFLTEIRVKTGTLVQRLGIKKS